MAIIHFFPILMILIIVYNVGKKNYFVVLITH